MTLTNTADRWGGVSQALHWLIAILILGLGALGFAITNHVFPQTPKYFWIWTAHKSLGIMVLALMAARLVWRLYAGAPAPVPNTSKWQHAIAIAAHALLYVLALAIPLAGWLYDSASSLRPFKLFGLVVMPKLVDKDEALKALSHFAHEWGFWLLIALVLLHAGAALQHHFFMRDATLARMLPRGWLNDYSKDTNRVA